MSPRTSTWTEILGSSADTDDTAFGGECLTYRLGSNRRIAVNMVEAIVASIRSTSSIVTWLQEPLSSEFGSIRNCADHLQIFGAIPEVVDKELRGNLLGM